MRSQNGPTVPFSLCQFVLTQHELTQLKRKGVVVLGAPVAVTPFQHQAYSDRSVTLRWLFGTAGSPRWSRRVAPS
jgi:hypothetical protein